MKKLTLLVAAFGVLGFLDSVQAADMPVKAPALAAPTYDWNGLYLGANWGRVIGQANAHTTSTFNNVIGRAELNDARLTGGAQIGFNWQFTPNFLIGVEGDIGYLGTNREFQIWNSSNHFGTKSTWYSTVRGRFGYVTGPSVLYVTGGAAFVRIQDFFLGDAPAAGVLLPVRTSSVESGWTLGGGIDTKLSQRWSARVEYLYMDLGNKSFPVTVFGFPDTVVFNHHFHVLKSGLNYHFGGSGAGDEGLPFFSGRILSPAHNWTGWYVGVNVGGGLSVTHAVATPTIPGDNTGATDINGAGFAGGGHVGYNLMVGPRWFAGLEGDIGYLGINHSTTPWNSPNVFNVKTNWYGTVRGRIGSNTGPALLYATGGAAFVHLTDSYRFFIGPPLADSETSTAVGWTAGGGIETALNARWSVRLEYLYMDVGSSNLSTPVTGRPFSFPAQISNRFQIVRAGLSYSFGGDDVIQSRY